MFIYKYCLLVKMHPIFSRFSCNLMWMNLVVMSLFGQWKTWVSVSLDVCIMFRLYCSLTIPRVFDDCEIWTLKERGDINAPKVNKQQIRCHAWKNIKDGIRMISIRNVKKDEEGKQAWPNLPTRLLVLREKWTFMYKSDKDNHHNKKDQERDGKTKLEKNRERIFCTRQKIVMDRQKGKRVEKIYLRFRKSIIAGWYLYLIYGLNDVTIELKLFPQIFFLFQKVYFDYIHKNAQCLFNLFNWCQDLFM